MLQKERQKQLVAAGLKKTTFKRCKHVEEHYDDCGDNTSILEKALVDTSAYHADNDDDNEMETAATRIPAFIMLESLKEKLPTSVAVMRNIDEFATYLSKVRAGIDNVRQITLPDLYFRLQQHGCVRSLGTSLS